MPQFQSDELRGASLTKLQSYVKKISVARGFEDDTLAQKFMLLLEEAGELAQAARKSAGMKTSGDSVYAENLKEEIGDVFIVLLSICNKLGIDAETAIIEKEAKNSERTWA